uniref:Uncharacterized protein n=1 Tax=Acrobeloides nanus TaxID=290746 RepID=A0A914CZX0_9BILA
MFIADSLKIWQKITEELGTPNQDFLSRVSEPARAYVMSQPVYKAKPWVELFPDNVFPPRGTYERPITTPRAGRDLLSKMLVIDPHYRISINQALEHEFVEWPDEVDTVTPPLSKYTGSTDGVQMSENEWK